MKISKRLSLVADMAEEGKVVADIGTDHAYVPMKLVKEKKYKKAIAMDINQGPLDIAKKHIAEEGLSDYIETRLSNGLEKLKKQEADAVIIAGMGGALIMSLLEQGRSHLTDGTRLVLQPQSEWMEFRKYLYENQIEILDEKMLEEDGKYYIILKCQKNKKMEKKEPMPEYYFSYGEILIKKKHPALSAYLYKQLDVTRRILNGLKKETATVEIQERQKELQKQIVEIQQALKEMSLG